MAHKEIEANDPMELVGVMLPADAEAMREMATVFAEEFARMGFEGGEIISLFRNPFYAGAHGAYLALGEKKISTIVDECIAAWGGVQFSILDVGFSIGDGGREIQNRQSKIQHGGREG
jgi:hypothetical protein